MPAKRQAVVLKQRAGSGRDVPTKCQAVVLKQRIGSGGDMPAERQAGAPNKIRDQPRGLAPRRRPCCAGAHVVCLRRHRDVPVVCLRVSRGEQSSPNSITSRPADSSGVPLDDACAAPAAAHERELCGPEAAPSSMLGMWSPCSCRPASDGACLRPRQPSSFRPSSRSCALNFPSAPNRLLSCWMRFRSARLAVSALTSASSETSGSIQRYVSILPLPLTSRPPVACHCSLFVTWISSSYVVCETWMRPDSDVDSMRLAVFIVSPKMENLGCFKPTRPDTHGPVCSPSRICTGVPSCGILTLRERASTSFANSNTRIAESTGSCFAAMWLKPSASICTMPPATM
mmetsp:Transcript_4120/g.11799  ORF Transcript_4120/g.11799 Transcript_4120/m.11799 type:complete len:344 (-) Transcript_4120:605-1636(-)